MAISIIFSLSLYHVSSADLDHNVNRQIGYFNNILGPDESTNYRTLRNRQLDEDKNHLKANLIIFNILVLGGGGGASYWLARRTLEPIEAALDSQARFASDASHELRTPLTVIQAENEVALRDKNLSKNRAISLLKSNLEETGKLKKLSEGLLRLANQNGVIDDPKSLPVNQLAAEAIERYQKAADSKKIKIKNITSEQQVLGDKESLVELLAIFIDNAIKYSPGRSEVTLSSINRSKNVLIKIKDNGYGIRQSELPHIFERFYRSDTSRQKTSEGGYGLGLAIAKKITDAHSGHIEVTSTKDKGTAFTIFLPAA